VSVADHKKQAPPRVRVAAITVSDTRTEATDEGGRLIAELAAAAGFEVTSKVIVPDEPVQVAALVKSLVAGGTVEAVLLTGGTGISRRDTTVEALVALFDKRLDGFGELFRMLSFAEVGAAAMLSRAMAGVVGGVAVFLMPGSPAGVRLALEKLILPELGHIVAQLARRPGHDHHPSHHDAAAAKPPRN
jgi:molybdopterin adenylyltransferase